MAKVLDFNPVLRTLLDGDPRHLNQIISRALTDIDAKASKIRTENEQLERDGHRPGPSPQVQLRDDVERLQTAIERARLETINAIDSEIEKAREEWTRARDRSPDAELAAIRRAENRFKGISDDQARELARTYTDGGTDLNMFELNEARARLQAQGPDGTPYLQGLNEAAAARHGDEPWKQAPAISEMVDYRGALTQLKNDEVFVSTEEHGSAVLKASELIDYNGELDEPL